MTDREAQIEALWTYEISTEKVLRRAVKKGFITQAEADEFSEKLFEQLDKKIPGFLPQSLVEKMRAEQVNVNPYVSMAEIAKEKKSSSPDCLIQSWIANEPRQGRRDNSASRDSNDVSGVVVSEGHAGIGAVLSDVSAR